MCYMRARNKNPGYRRSSHAKPARARETAATYPSDMVGVRELRQNLSVYLDEVKLGRTLIVTEHGQQVAVLAPAAPKTSILDRLVAEGKMTAPTRRIADLRPPLEEKLEKPVSQILQEMRDEDPW